MTLQWSVVDPVKLVGFSGETKPHAPSCDCLLLLHQAKDEVVFSSCPDYGEVSSQILASSPSVAPLQGWDVDDEETRLSTKNPTFVTSRSGN